MSSIRSRRAVAAVAGGLGFALVLTACSSGDSGGGSDASGDTTADCADFEVYGDLSGKEVDVYTGIVTPEDTPYMDSYKPFEECTGAKIVYTGDKAFETQILVRAKAGNPPDIAIVPQPGLLQQLVATGAAVEAPADVAANVDEFWGEDWKAYGSVDGTFYAAPSGASVKSLVWYSPTEFADSGYEVPTTLDDLMALTEQIQSDGKVPWCAGIGSGEATGWPITDWMEDFMLRLSGPEVYDQWVNHEIPFNSPESEAALDGVGDYLKNPDFVNGGLGDVTSIATTTFQDGGLPILEGTCSLHRQASFYASNFPEGTTVAEDGDVFAFYLPGETEEDHPVLGGGEFNLAFSDAPEVQAFQTYLSSDLWANTKATISSEATGGGWISANTGLDVANLTNPIDQLAAGILQDPNTVFRFDGSDMMPAAVGSNAFWKQATNWITGQSTKETVDNIEAAWPAS
ncbi:ABC transporter substrate-binding protein [Pengzhenrongella sicca]|uniref:Carbohydrate ABC transporter substrate-binding protein n=1 Tax=Pengzhenrongella sicca TaxID=2819238 RepID=A0A8A4ZE56_9MICO|nr:ABC transporter substrate-binding protein [Pengzhenrongella sicca]QTE29595.1 carbohydrate ABC transporter substrate-binding protein [Pengzhenrongella sicca]